MITDDLLMYMLFQLILLVINIIGFKKLPILLFFGIIGTVMLSVPTIEAFEDYYMMAILFIIVNISIPIIGLTTTMKGE